MNAFIDTTSEVQSYPADKRVCPLVPLSTQDLKLNLSWFVGEGDSDRHRRVHAEAVVVVARKGRDAREHARGDRYAFAPQCGS